jgi:hypothetical protein
MRAEIHIATVAEPVSVGSDTGHQLRSSHGWFLRKCFGKCVRDHPLVPYLGDMALVVLLRCDLHLRTIDVGDDVRFVSHN